MRSEEEYLADYKKYRGKCKEMAEAAMKGDPSLTLVRGYYICDVSGKQHHWWTVRPDGSIFDPSCRQFPSNGSGQYVPFTGEIECDVCGKEVTETEVYRFELSGRDALCSEECYGKYIGWDM
jgi:hypothetical protein